LNTQKQIVLIVALLFIFVGGCAAYTAIDLPIRAEDQSQWTKDQSLERGALLFANNCRTCHGNRGQGLVGPQLLANEATNFQNQDPLILKANRDLIRRTLYCGRAGTLMPAWLNTNGGSLNAVQIEHLIDFITAPIKQSESGDVESEWWDAAEGFAHNLNDEVSVLVGGDTLGTIAKAHGIGPKELAAANNRPVEGIIKKGTELKIPGHSADPNGYTYTVYKNNETITKIAEAQFVGAAILADLNGIKFTFSEKRGVATMELLNADGKAIPGLFPKSTLKLPGGATYKISAGDTIASVAAKHSITTGAVTQLNSALLSGLKDSDEIPFEQRLKLPKQTAIVQEGQTLGTVAQQHAITVEALSSENGLDKAAAPPTGTALKLPSGAQYVVQAGDTWESAAQAHATDAASLASANGKDPNSTLDPAVFSQLPQINAYVVQGQDLKAVAAGYGNVTAESLADKNGVKPTDTLAVGTTLKLPADAFGSAPPTSKNPGTACVQYAVSKSVFEGIVSPTTAATAPANVSNSVKVEAHATDWTVTGDGTAQPANKGVVLVAKGTTIPFTSVSGLHTVTRNGQKEGDDLTQGSTKNVTFNDAGQFKITCDYHVDMLAYVFVQ
jgi:LysM repeat protein/mono/diheme cytochrome c family protein